MLSRFNRRIRVPVASFLCMACSEGEPAPLETVEWHLAETPVVRIGVADGALHYQFHHVRDVQRLSDGRIVVADGGSNEVRFYDEDARYLRMSGGAGEGPSEFRSLSSVAVLAGDSLLALDGGKRRISVFDPLGHYVRSWVAESPGPGLLPARVHALDDGSVLISYIRGHRPSDPPGLFRGSAPLVRYSAEGETLNVVTEVPGDEWFYSAEHRTLRDRAFGRKGHLAVGAGEVHVGSGEAEVLVYNATGELRRTIPIEAPQAVTADQIRAYSAARLQAVSEPEQPAIEAQLAEMPYPETMPAYAGLLVDRHGNLWTRDYEFPQTPTARWKVRSPQGGVLATISLPASFEPSFAYADQLGGVITDELGVETVVIFELRQKQRNGTYSND